MQCSSRPIAPWPRPQRAASFSNSWTSAGGLEIVATMRWRALCLVGLAAAATLAAGMARGAAVPQPVWVVLDDRSLDSTLTTRGDGVLEIRLAGEAAVKAKGRVYADGFAENALSRLRFPIFTDFSKPPPTYSGKNPDLLKLARDAQVAGLVGRGSALLLKNLGERGSDIIGALLATVRGPLNAAHGRVLIVLDSNMLVYSLDDRLFFTDSVPRRLVATLDRLAARGRIPDLHGACVLVTDVGKLDDNSIGTTRFLAVERFWRAYFARAHAKLVGWLPRAPASLHPPCA